MRQNTWIWAAALLATGAGLSADEEATAPSETVTILPEEQMSEPLEPVVVEVETTQEVIAAEETASQETEETVSQEAPVPVMTATKAPKTKKQKRVQSMAPKKEKSRMSAAQAVIEEETRLYYEVDE